MMLGLNTVKLYKVKALIPFSSKRLLTIKPLCFWLGALFFVSLNSLAAEKSYFEGNNKLSKLAANEDNNNDGLQQTLELNFSPESREKLRKALDDYARSIDQDHDRIEERRRAMQESLEARFFDADNDNDGTIDRQEATEKLPQIARHFNQVDTNQDKVISLDELADAQARILERRRAAEAAIEAQKLQAASDAADEAKSKNKPKQSANSNKKRAL
jgi:Ca2+-binding EF-hand superfamily protein